LLLAFVFQQLSQQAPWEVWEMPCNYALYDAPQRHIWPYVFAQGCTYPMHKRVHAGCYHHSKITLPFTSLLVSDTPDCSLKEIKRVEMLILSKEDSNSDFPLLCILLLLALCAPYSQLNRPFLGAVAQLFSDIQSGWELGSLPTPCTCD